jgi:hypothetical protein
MTQYCVTVEPHAFDTTFCKDSLLDQVRADALLRQQFLGQLAPVGTLSSFSSLLGPLVSFTPNTV